MFATALGSRAIRCCQLHHRRLLVHRVNLIREPGSDYRPLLVRHFRWHSTLRCPAVHRGPTCGSLGRDFPVSRARPGLAGTRGPSAGASHSLERQRKRYLKLGSCLLPAALPAWRDQYFGARRGLANEPSSHRLKHQYCCLLIPDPLGGNKPAVELRHEERSARTRLVLILEATS